jgi:beta-carotene 15,15'-dioxygenase
MASRSYALWTAGLISMLCLLVWDHLDSQAGLVMFAAMVLSLGTVHGAMDVLLLMRLLPNSTQRIRASAGYLVASLAVAALMLLQPGIALMLLLALSIWHFGECFAQSGATTRAQRWVLRALRGGAPVLLPAVVNRPALHRLIEALMAPDQSAAQWVWALWSTLAWAWLACGVWGLVWVCRCSASEKRQKLLPKIGTEISLLLMLYAAASPLMAFAVFFGMYHSAGHIRRVIGHSPATPLPPVQDRRPLFLITAATTAMTLFLGSALAWWIHSHTLSTPAWALHSLIVALTAVSVPHVVLVSWWAGR